jgi:phage terminase large subunit GpA-like protein
MRHLHAGKLAAEFLAAKDDPAMLKPFVNTALAELWRDAGDEIVGSELRIEAFSLRQILPQVLCITAGADVQDDRVEVTFCGHARNGTIFVLGHSVLYGPTSSNEVWQDLDDALRKRWPHSHGGTIGVDAAIIDAGDGLRRIAGLSAGSSGRS